MVNLYISDNLYTIIKIAARLLLKIFFQKKVIAATELFETRGPLLLVANHPNSFLDAIIIGATCKYPVHYLARGDAFQKKPLQNIAKWITNDPHLSHARGAR